MQETREYSTFTFYTGRFAYDGYNERYRFLEGLPDEHEPEYAHYFFFKEVSYYYDSVVHTIYTNDSYTEISAPC